MRALVILLVTMTACRTDRPPAPQYVATPGDAVVPVDASSSRVLALPDLVPAGTVAKDRVLAADGRFRCAAEYRAVPDEDSADCLAKGYVIDARVVYSFGAGKTLATPAIEKLAVERVDAICAPARKVTPTPQLLAKIAPDLAKAPTEVALPETPSCRDPRIAFSISTQVQHRLDGAAHVFHADVERDLVTLRVAGRDVHAWTLGRAVADVCGKQAVTLPWSASIDVTCTGDVAIVSGGVALPDAACSSRGIPVLPFHVTACDASVVNGRQGSVRDVVRLRVNLVDGTVVTLSPVDSPRFVTGL